MRAHEFINEEKLNEDWKKLIPAFAIVGGLILGGEISYQDYNLGQEWMQTYNLIKDSNPEQAQKIKQLVDIYKTTNWKQSVSRELTKQEIKKIIDDVRTQTRSTS